MRLSDLEKAKIATIHDVEDNEATARLFEYGIVPGALIEVISRAPFKGPIYVKVDQNLVALRVSEAKSVLIKNE